MGIVHVDKPSKCDICGNKYAGMGPDFPKYGYMNAGTIFQREEPTDEERKESEGLSIPQPELVLGKWYIDVGYGSVLFDGELFLFKDDLQPVFDGLVVCDSCIAELTTNGSILKIWDYFNHKP